MINTYASIVLVAVVVTGQLLGAMQSSGPVFDPKNVALRDKASIEKDLGDVNKRIKKRSEGIDLSLKQISQIEGKEGYQEAIERLNNDVSLDRDLLLQGKANAAMFLAEWWRADSKMWQEKYEKLKRQIEGATTHLESIITGSAKEEAAQPKK